MCINQLENDSYEQMLYEKFELLNCNEDTFKFVLHHHNERRWEDPSFGQSDKFIKELMEEYCKHNKYCEKEKSQLYKDYHSNSTTDFPSFNKGKLTPLKIH